MSLHARFAARVKEIRRRRDLSQAQLAERIGRSVNAVSALERGASLPTFETLERLAEALATPVPAFFDTPAAGSSDVRQERHIAKIAALCRELPEADLTLVQGILELIAKREAGARP